jgi:hypothetical protein
MKIYHGYQLKDSQIDYKMYPHRGTYLRGLKPTSDDYISCIGSAVTFGRLCEQPFVNIISATIGLDVYNFSAGGLGISDNLFTDNIDIINKSKFCLLQVLSGRSSHCSEYEHLNDRIGFNIKTNTYIMTRDFWQQCILNYPEVKVKKLVDEMLENYISDYKYLISKIKVPIILIHFSHGLKQKPIKYTSVSGIFKGFPHIVDQEHVDQIRSMVSGYVKVEGKDGYYPNQNHHNQIADGVIQLLTDQIYTTTSLSGLSL